MTRLPLTEQLALAETKRIFQVYDRHTGLNLGKPLGTRKAAHTKVDRLDNAYGAYRYGVRTI